MMTFLVDVHAVYLYYRIRTVSYTYRTIIYFVSDVERVKERNALKGKLPLFEIARIVL